MRHSKATISFFILVAVAAVAAYGALVWTAQLSNQDESTVAPMAETGHKQKTEVADKQEAQPKAEALDTSTWKDYTDRSYFLSFKYPDQWSLQTYPNREGYYIISIKPNKGSDNIRIYVSPSSYFALAGLPSKKTTLAGAQGVNIIDSLIGVKFAAQYYTFDSGTDSTLRPQFQKILSTVALSK